MSKQNNRGNSGDRRQKNIKKLNLDKRMDVRRKEDKNNLITYYLVLAFTLFILFAFGIASFIYSY